MIEFIAGFFLDPWDVKAVREVTDKTCALWLTGQNAENGFVLPYSAQEVVQAVMDAREESSSEEEE